MKTEFQALLCPTLNNNGFTPVGQPFTVSRIAEGEDQVRDELSASGFKVLGVTAVRAVVDWSKPALTRDEFAALLGVTADTVSKAKATGHFPFAAIGNGLYPTALVHAFIRKNLNPAGKALAEELRQEAA